MKQTAVEWLTEQINTPQWRTLKRADIIEQAKQREKEQIGEAYETRRRILDPDENGVIKLMSGEQYYNETYGKDESNH